jgi:hypothetical protein
MFHIKADITITVNAVDPETRAAVERLTTSLTLAHKKLDALVEAIVPGQAVSLGLKPGAVTEQPS